MLIMGDTNENVDHCGKEQEHVASEGAFLPVQYTLPGGWSAINVSDILTGWVDTELVI